MSLLGHDKRAVKLWEAAPEEMGLEATAEDDQWWCWRDMLRNTIPDIKVQSLTVDSSVSQTISNDDMCGRHVRMVYTQNSMWPYADESQLTTVVGSSPHLPSADICCRWSDDLQHSARWSTRSRGQHSNLWTVVEDTSFLYLSARLVH